MYKYSILMTFFLINTVHAVTLSAAATSSCVQGLSQESSSRGSEYEYSLAADTFIGRPIQDVDEIATRVFGPEVNPNIQYAYRMYHNRSYRPSRFYSPKFSLSDIDPSKTRKKKFSTQKKKREILRTLTHTYKIHCMPNSSSDFLYKLFEFLEQNPEVAEKIYGIKYAVRPGQTTDITPARIGYANHALVVIYVYGHDDAQYVLDRIYGAFKDEPGRGQLPRFSTKVTDLLSIAQGHGDDKIPYLSRKKKNFIDPTIYWELPHRIYFSQAVAQELKVPHESFYLHHPTTGAILNTSSGIPLSSRSAQLPRKQGSLSAGPSLSEARQVSDSDATHSRKPKRLMTPANKSPHLAE